MIGSDLSQAEIDALFNQKLQEDSGADPATLVQEATEAREYDFRRPDRLSRDHLRAFQSLYQTFARGASVTLAAYFRTNVQITLTTITQGNSDQITGSPDTGGASANATVMCGFTLDPLPGTSILYLSTPVSLAALDRLLGGIGYASAEPRSMTDLELYLTSGALEKMLASYREAWEPIIDVRVRPGDTMQGLGLGQFSRRAEAVVVGDFEIKLGEQKGELGIVVPYTTIEPLLPRLTEQFWMGGVRHEAGAETSRASANKELAEIDLVVAAQLGAMRTTLGELAQLEVGDVLRLSSIIGRPIDVTIGGITKYRAMPGVSGHRLALRMTGPAEGAVATDPLMPDADFETPR
jgi:flagellar motor switch protein FliM